MRAAAVLLAAFGVGQRATSVGLAAFGADPRTTSTGPLALVTLNPFRATASMSNDSTGWPGTIEEGRLAYELNWRCYAKLHGYTLYIERDDQSARHLFPPSEKGLTGALLARWAARASTRHPELLPLPPPYSPFWCKVVLVERFLPTSPWVLYYDSDAIFVSLPSRLEDVLSRVASDATDLVVITNTFQIKMAVKTRLCACIFAVRSTPGGWWFLKRWLQLSRIDASFGDMGSFSQAVVEMHLRHAAFLREGRAAAAAHGAPPPPWHSAHFDSVVSPCLHVHWSLADSQNDYHCMAVQMMQVLTEFGGTADPDGPPRVDEPTGWPVAWSTELAANVQRRQMGLVGYGGATFVPSKRNYPARLAVVRDLVLRRRAREQWPARAVQPALLAHHKTGKHYILTSLYHRTAIDKLARACPRRIACVEPLSFVNGSLFGVDAPNWQLPPRSETDSGDARGC